MNGSKESIVVFIRYDGVRRRQRLPIVLVASVVESKREDSPFGNNQQGWESSPEMGAEAIGIQLAVESKKQQTLGSDYSVIRKGKRLSINGLAR